MKYASYQYLYPPRADTKRAIPPSLLPAFERMGWWGQYKKNGQNTPVFASGEDVRFRGRHGDTAPLNWTPKEHHIEFFGRLTCGRGWFVFCTELLHNKVHNGPRDELYIYDVLVAEGAHLTGTTFEARQRLLDGLLGDAAAEQPTTINGAIRYAPGILRAQNMVPGTPGISFEHRYAHERRADDEGLMVKDPKGRLAPCFKEGGNTFWQAKARQATKNYAC